MIAKVVCLCLLATAMVVAAEESAPAQRFFSTTKTTVVYTTTSTWQITTVTSACASLYNVTGACRRRRGIEEQPILMAMDDDLDVASLMPTKTLSVEASAAPESTFEAEARSQVTLESSADFDESGNNRGRGVVMPLFTNFMSGISSALAATVYTTSTSTLTLTSYVTGGTVLKTFIIQGCTPSPFSYGLC